MNTRTTLWTLALATMLSTLASATAAADWTLDPAASSLGFVSVKNGSIAEGHRFEALSGEVTGGHARLTIDLASVDTSIEIRDQRMRDLLFEVADFPQAVFETEISPMAVSGLAVGGSMPMEVSGTLSIHGVSVPLTAALLVTRDASDRISVATTKPLVLSVEALGLSAGVARLQEIAGLAGITPMVPVAFSLTFDAVP
ncbi:MAG TPA: YceI family protein [Pseudomonadales bacterium]|nr:YceI family protein [Pseudomonadales bacterium]